MTREELINQVGANVDKILKSHKISGSDNHFEYAVDKYWEDKWREIFNELYEMVMFVLGYFLRTNASEEAYESLLGSVENITDVLGRAMFEEQRVYFPWDEYCLVPEIDLPSEQKRSAPSGKFARLTDTLFDIKKAMEYQSKNTI